MNSQPQRSYRSIAGPLKVSLNIEGIFDNAWWLALKTQPLAYKCTANLYSMVWGYLQDRDISLSGQDEVGHGFIGREDHIVIEPMILYASCTWAPYLSLHSALIFSKLLPLDIRLAHVPEIEYKSVQDLDSQTLDRLSVVGPQICTDGNRIVSKVGAALVECQDVEETWVKNGNNGLVDIFSDSRSFLEVLTGPKSYHPLAHEARRDLFEIFAEGKAVQCAYSGLECMLESRETCV
ncbi:hypothetical protein EVAR_25763_1 [Eumeta japonica]|uniref:Uncharacterized protein n=1 Tax=Eumeta variegata TaxID=151549 RepID=A0A4C1V7C0_EUMVA|nr:hypothetical protein EVAR_25763_1 [Eumeta japonica]